ncbi:MAG: hypothetical protein ACOC2M_01420 [bacterium]
MEKTVNLKMSGLMEMGKKELEEIDGGDILARVLGGLLGSLIEQTYIAGNYYYQDGNYMYSPLR